MDDSNIGATLAVVGGANASVGTMVQVASQGMFERNQRISPIVSSMRHSKRKKLVGEEFLLLHSALECNELFQQVFVEKYGKKQIWGSECGLYYIKLGSLHWWDQFSNLVMREDPQRFRQFFHLLVPTFHYLCSLVHEELESNPPPGLINIIGRLMEVPKQVAIALRRLGTGDTHVSVGELFGVADSTSVVVCQRFIAVLIKVALPLHLSWPRGERVLEVKLGFENLHGIPQCCGALDCSHIRFDLPANTRSSDWYDRDHNYSTVMQAIVDHEARFTDVFVGVPGSIHDSRILLMSNHFKEVIAGRRLNGSTIEIQGVDVCEHIIGDAGYVGDKNLLVPWPGIELPVLYEEYNFKHSSTRMVVERAFGILKGMWRILRNPITNPNLKKIPSLIVACYLLHNIVIDRKDMIDEAIVLWGHHDFGYAQQFVQSSPQNDGEQLQMAIARHLYLLEAMRLNE